ncbi:MAG: glycerophosphodiester phosphodiesterase [Oscillatoriales cyanobacterium]|nr:MAG: glycerophosphodiester phosphodiesterase [Oscillatoriales cyanobacterium]
MVHPMTSETRTAAPPSGLPPFVDVIAHRGYSAGAPENTIIAFEQAIALGARSIELDIQWTRDDVPVVTHDPSLGRTIAGSGRIADLTWDELQTCDAGSWFNAEFSDQRVPSFEQVLQQVHRLPGQLFLDLKPYCQWSKERVALLLDLLDRYQWRDRSVACSFDPDVADRFNADIRNPMAIGYSLATPDSFDELFPRAITAGAVLVCAYDMLLADPDLIWEAHAAGLEIVAWTVDQLEDMQRLSDFGIDRVITNCLLPHTAAIEDTQSAS